MYVPLDEPVDRRPFSAKFSQCCVATVIWPESMTGFLKVGAVRTVVDRFQDEAHGLLNHFVDHTGNAELSHLAVRLLSTPAHFCARIILTPLSYKLPTVKTI